MASDSLNVQACMLQEYNVVKCIEHGFQVNFNRQQHFCGGPKQTHLPVEQTGGSGLNPCVCVQEYNVGKRIEHSYKSIFNNGNSISAVDPRRYSQRFQEFMQKVFV